MTQSGLSEARRYKSAIVGESRYQAAIRRCRPGEPAQLRREPTNPHDARAVAVVSGWGETIGYLGRDSWLQRAVADEGQGARVSIASIEAAPGGDLGVVLDVVMDDTPIAEQAYARGAGSAASAPASRGFGQLAGICAALLVAIAIAGVFKGEPSASPLAADPAAGERFTPEETATLLAMPAVPRLVGAAPDGLAALVAADALVGRSLYACARVTDAVRLDDGSVVAKCEGGATYRVGRMVGAANQPARACADMAALTRQAC